MKAIIVLFDSLNRRFLPNYGCEEVAAPAFERLGDRCAVFDSCFSGSLPCIPARRDLHTGRYNFLHREWGPLEPFDNSVFALLRQSSVYCHLVTDHYNYWEDGGAGYHTRYSSFEFIRGQEGDRWKGHVAGPAIPPVFKPLKSHSGGVASAWRANWVNRQSLDPERLESWPTGQVFSAAEEFITRNASTDSWLLQIESFSPHEPFLAPDEFLALYPHAYAGDTYDWPRGRLADDEDQTVIEHIRCLYKASISMVDRCLGRILDRMDRHNLWEDTLLIVGSDHGILLGEHGYWSKNVMPYYNEAANIPLFIYDPRSPGAQGRRRSLVQMIDWAPTLLNYFGIPVPPQMQGADLAATVRTDARVRDSALFGLFGGHVNLVTDGHIYMRAASPERAGELFNYTLMPAHMFSPFTPAELKQAECVKPFSFTQGCPILRIRAKEPFHLSGFPSMLFDRKKDPGQSEPLAEPELEKALSRELAAALKASDAPAEQYYRLMLEDCE